MCRAVPICKQLPRAILPFSSAGAEARPLRIPHIPAALPNDLPALLSFDGRTVVVEPDDGAAGASLDGLLCAVVFSIIDHRQIVYHRDEVAGRIHGAFAAGRTSHPALFQNIVAGLQVFAVHPQPVAHGLQRKQVFRTSLHAVAAGRAFVHIHHRQPVGAHGDGIEIADHRTIAQTEATPETAFAAAGYQRSRPAGGNAVILRAIAGHIRAAAASQPGYPLFFSAQRYAEVLGNALPPLVGAHGTLAGQRLAGHQSLRKGAATGKTAGPAVGMWQHVFHRVYAGIFIDVELLVGYHEHDGQCQREAAQCGKCDEDGHGLLSCSFGG